VKILVTFALENEFAPWRAMHKFCESTWGQADVFAAEIGGADVAVLLTGVGQRPAKLALSKIAWGESGTLEYCVSSGLAGGLRPEYSIAQVVAAREIASEGARDKNGDSNVTSSSSSLISFASECGASVVNRFYSAERAIGRPDEKKHLGKNADAVEMESFEIVAAATDAGVPAVAVRAISDILDEPLPLDMNEVFNDEGQLSIPRVVGQVALHPQAVPGLVRLGQQSKKAAESLAQFLDRYIARIATSAQPIELKAAAQ
jgi:adenosylhomocysteine nucleosidase